MKIWDKKPKISFNGLRPVQLVQSITHAFDNETEYCSQHIMSIYIKYFLIKFGNDFQSINT